MKRRIFAVAVLAMLTVASSAFAAGKGTSMLSLGLGQGSAPVQNVLSVGSGLVIPGSEDAISAGAQYWYLFSDDYALAISGAALFGNQTWESSDLVAEPEIKASVSGYKFRIGGDRVGSVGDRFKLYFGPGFEYASAKVKAEQDGSPDIETDNSTFYGINGRVGGIMMLSDKIGISGEISNSFGITSAEDDSDGIGTAKSSWTTSDFSAFWGLTFAFGGSN